MSEHDDHPASQQSIRAEAIESLLIDKGLIDEAAVDEVIVQFNERVGPMNGARIVAKAWKDPDFKSRLLADGTRAIEEFEFTGGQVEKLVVVENTPEVHNVVVCTLWSCYPWAVLGLPPKWYKDPSYRARVVREPRRVLEDFGVEISASKELRVWDSSAEIRYMVLPEPPSDGENQSEEELAARVSRDAMIGVALL
ncbi:MAG: nitrile hydratase subunit alpha [Gammaproteobacteria bacterium]|nr:nitrile hydratase subunit alpha [Gammaproteobacteria bacterium]